VGGGSGMEIKKWSWLVFPLLVGVTVVFSSKWLIAGPDQIWRKLWLTGREVQTAEVEVAKLKNKLDKLKRVDITGQRKILEKLEAAVPRRGQVEVLIGEVMQAASESAVAVQGYEAGSGGLKVTLQTGDLGQLAAWVDNMERRLPLVKIVNISYMQGRAEVTVEQVGKEFVASGAKPEEELPEADVKVENVLEKLFGFRETGLEQSRDTGGTNPNPF